MNFLRDFGSAAEIASRPLAPISNIGFHHD